MMLNFFLKRTLIDEDVVLFVCSTTGQGDPPDNMQVYLKFKTYLNNDLKYLKTCLIELLEIYHEEKSPE